AGHPVPREVPYRALLSELRVMGALARQRMAEDVLRLGIRDDLVAYHAQLGEQRAQLHAGVAAALQKLRVDRLGEYAALIAHHWDASGRRYEAARWRRRAGLRVSSIKLKGRGPGSPQ